MPHSECFVDGKWFPSVTTIMNAEPKPWLQAWHEKWGPLAERKVTISNAIGTAFHDCVEQYLTAGRFEVRMGTYSSCVPRVVGMMKSFVDWAGNVEGDVHETELKVISRLHTYSGTLDAVGSLNGKPILFDWKTSSRIYDDYVLQLSAYAQAYKEEKGMDIKEGLIVQVSKDKPYFKLTTKAFKLGKRVFNRFLKLRAMFDDMKAREDNEKDAVVEETGY